MTLAAAARKNAEDLIALAAKATPGPYIVQGIGCQGPRRFIRIATENARNDPGVAHGITKFAQHNAENNAAYFGALDPASVTALAQAYLSLSRPQAGTLSVVDEIAAERQRQIVSEGWTPEHDDTEHFDGQLARAAAGYAMYAGGRTDLTRAFVPGEKPTEATYVPRGWPWAASWWKPKDKRRDLIRAAALIAAEIERLDRLTTPPATEEDACTRAP